MNNNNNKIEIAKHITLLFGAYGKSDDINRAYIYVADLQSIPADIICQACKILRLHSKFIPSISEICNLCIQISNDNNHECCKTWPEALLEIKEQTLKCGSYKQPIFSRPEITQTMAAYGWYNWCMTPESQIPFAQIQLENLYKSICNKSSLKRTTKYVLSNNTQGLLGYKEVENNNMTCVRDTLKIIKEANNND